MNSSLAVARNRKVAALSGPVVPRLVAASGTDATMRFLNFFATQIENDNTRAAYLRAAREFLARCDGQKIGLLTDIQPVHVAAWIKQSKLSHSIPTATLRLAAIRHLFDWLVTGHVMQTNPALSVRGPRDAMMADPILINRPIVVTADTVKLCRPSETVLDLLSQPQRGPFAKEDGEAVIDARGNLIPRPTL